MIGILYLLFFLAGGVFIARCWLPRRHAVARWYLGAALGVFLLMWLPALWAYAVSFSLPGHGLAAGTLALLAAGAYFTRDKAAPLPFGEKDRQQVKLLLWIALPLTLLAGYLEYTHSICPTAGGYYVGQSTYGDLSLHLAVTTSAVNAAFPLQNSLMVGATMAYPYLSDTIATSMLMLGMGLPAAMAFTGTLLCLLVFAGYTLLAAELCRKKGAAALAVLLLFLNGGLGFFYTLSGTVESGVRTTLWDNLNTVMTGYYKTPTNQPDPNNLRWVNVICDMLIPQRGFLGGWSMLMPAFLLVLPPLVRRGHSKPVQAAGELTPERLQGRGASSRNPQSAAYAEASEALRNKAPLRLGRAANAQGAGTRQKHIIAKAGSPLFQNVPRAYILAGIIAGGMPLLHTHSFLALGLSSIGFCAYAVLDAPRGGRLKAFQPFLWYGVIAAALAFPQLISLTFKQAAASDHFLRFQFNWCNNRGNGGLVDPYFWFYIKNIGVPYLLILLALFQRERALLPGDARKLARARRHNAGIRQYRLIAAGAFLILLIAELIIFQPNEYDNNKLIYVWFLLCLPMAADYALTLYGKIKAVGGRRLIAVLFIIICFLSAGLTVARECVSFYQAYTNEDIKAAEFISEHTPAHSVFLTGTQHLNPAASLAGRTIVCGSDLYLYFHGFTTTQRKAEVAAFYEDPAAHLGTLSQYGVEYIYLSAWERSSYLVDTNALDSLFTRVYESPQGGTVIWRVSDAEAAGAAVDAAAAGANAAGAAPAVAGTAGADAADAAAGKTV